MHDLSSDDRKEGKRKPGGLMARFQSRKKLVLKFMTVIFF